MTTALSLLIIAFVFANIPFVSQKSLLLFWLSPNSHGKKSLWLVVFDLLVYFVAFMVIAQWMEYRQGAIYPKTIDFYVITFTLFLVFAYPGYVLRYLYRAKP